MTIPFEPRAVVTGAASGLGRALCLALATRRANIVVSDIDLTGAEETAQLVVRLGGSARTQRCDVSKADEVEELARFADRELGGTDLLVNNAGVAVGGPVGEVPLEDWAWALNINLWGVIHGCHAFVPRLKQQRRGHVLNVASAAGLLSPPDMGPYNVGKAGVVALSETLYSELRAHGVGVTALCPTYFLTSIMASARSHSASELRSVAEEMMQRSKVQAPQVAERALSACDAGELYCVPMLDGQVAWRLKRLAPTLFYDKVLGTLFSWTAKGRARAPG